MAPHEHLLPIDYGSHSGTARGIAAWVDTAEYEGISYATQTDGSGEGHENRQPSLSLQYVIKA